MVYRYSRKAKTEEKKNLRRAVIFGILTLALLAVFFFYGLPAIIKFAAFLTDLKKSSTPSEISDSTPPPPPRFEPFPSHTNDLEIELKGSTEPGVTVILFLNNKNEEVLVNSEGDFNYDFELNDGKNTISAKAIDQAGNESQKTDTQTVTYDNDSPEINITKPQNNSEFFGSKERQIVIEGVTEEDASVSINGRKVVVESDGTFAFAITLSEGENQFTIKAEDRAGNSDEQSLLVTYTP